MHVPKTQYWNLLKGMVEEAPNKQNIVYMWKGETESVMLHLLDGYTSKGL